MDPEELENPAEAGNDLLDIADTEIDESEEGVETDDDQEITAEAEDETDESEDDGDVETDADDEEESEDAEEDVGPVIAQGDSVVHLPDGTETTVEALISGNLRQQDYSRNMDALKSVREKADKEAERISGVVTRVTEYLNSVIPPLPDANLLSSGDPQNMQTYLLQKQQHEDVKSVIVDLIKQKEEVQQTAVQMSADQVEEARKDGRKKLAQMFPETGTEAGYGRFMKGVQETAGKIGFSEEEVAKAMDPRTFATLHYAKLGMERAEAKKRGKAKLKAAKPSAPKKAVKPDQGATLRHQKAMTALRQDDSIDNAVAALMSGGG